VTPQVGDIMASTHIPASSITCVNYMYLYVTLGTYDHNLTSLTMYSSSSKIDNVCRSPACSATLYLFTANRHTQVSGNPILIRSTHTNNEIIVKNINTDKHSKGLFILINAFKQTNGTLFLRLS